MYDFKTIERRWQEAWERSGQNRQLAGGDKPKYYLLTMLPYPSGDLHVGHWYAMTPSDARARFMRMRGYNVLFPMGFDAFGLPAENAAIKHGIHPETWTRQNIERMRVQLRSMGNMFDWEREAVTCDPEYYKWNQWFFLQFYRRGLAYKKYAPVDWCPSCNTTLAREQVVGEERLCERCDTPVIKKDLDQWFFRITDYAEELLDFSKLDWPERVVSMQRNWIGRSEGVEFAFQVAERSDLSFRVFTTRIDTLYGASFAVLAPEHPLVAEITTPAQEGAVAAYRLKASRQSEIERLSTEKERDGVFTGAYAINPLSGERLPIWIADYVLMSYGTGAIMGVPAHDERDYDFARRYQLPVPVVIVPADRSGTEVPLPYTGDGRVVNSGAYSGLDNAQAWQQMADEIERRGIGKRAVNYRLRDWLISRQRYWGTPIPIVYCADCGTVPVPEEQLPVLLPKDVDFTPTGESPLRSHAGFLNTTCPRCGGPATRETDTMDTFVDSSWYHYRYLSPHDATAPFDPKEGAYWLPVDQYTGGVEHAVMHLLYTRFFTKAMRDLGLVPFDEPMLRLFNQGIILGEDGNRMSKSRGNVVAPDDLVARYGADVVRTYLMFMAPWDQGGPWNSKGIGGVVRFLNRVWRLVVDDVDDEATGSDTTEVPTPRQLWQATQRTIKKATDDLEHFRYNTMISALMELTNALTRAKLGGETGPRWQEGVRALLLCLAPIAPHLSEELWHRLGHTESIHLQAWPTYDEAGLVDDEVTVVVQINGKVRDRIVVALDASAGELERAALSSPRLAPFLQGQTVRKVITVPNKIVNLVVG